MKESVNTRFNQIGFWERTTYLRISSYAIASLTGCIPFGIDGNAAINLDKLSDAKSIFVRGDLLDKLVAKNMQNINTKILVTGNSDYNFVNLPVWLESVNL